MALTILVKESFNLTLIQELPRVIEESYLVTYNKINYYLNWALRTRFQEGAGPLKENLDAINNRCNELTAKEVESKEVWSAFEGFQTVDLFYQFVGSKVFENIFTTIMNKLDDIQQSDLQYY